MPIIGRGVATQQGSLLSSRFGFNQIRNRPAEEVCTLEEVIVEEHGFLFSSEAITGAIADEAKAELARDYLVALGLSHSPTLRSLDAQIHAEWRRKKSTRRWMIPSLTGGAGAAAFLLTGGEGADQQPAGSIFWRLGLQLDWAVLDGGYYIATMNQAKAQFGSLQWERENQATALEQDIRSTAAVAMKSFAVIELAEQGYTADHAYGNASTDIFAYSEAGIPAEHIWIIGENGGDSGTQSLEGGYEEHLDAVALFPDVDQPY